MPDLVTHILFTHIITRFPNLIKNKFLNYYNEYKVLIFIGAILPDLVSKPLQFIYMGFYNFTLPLHSPFCVTLACILISNFFYVNNKKSTFYTLWLFSMLHIFLDSFQRGMNPGYQLLFPYSFERIGLNLISSEIFIYLVVVFLFISIMIELSMYFKNKKIK